MLQISPAEMENYKSATDPPARDAVEQTILQEIREYNYEVVGGKPIIVGAIGAVPKPESDKYRLIHDCSMPPGC